MNTVKLVSPLPPDECVARLREAVDSEWLFFALGSKPLIGWIFRRRVFLRQRIGYRNSFQTILIGKFESHGEGSVFRGRAGLHPVVVVFMAVWFGALVCGGVSYCVPWVQGGLVGDQPLGLAALAFMGVFGALVVRLGHWLARAERQFLVAFLAGLLEAPGGENAESS